MTIKNCSNCGGDHYGSNECPYIEKPCVICGDGTIMACSDCAVASGGKNAVHVCRKPECRRQHDIVARHLATATVPQKRPFEMHPDLQRSIQQTWGRIYSEGLTLDAWNAMIREIDVALTVERNESYVRGMHDEHNEPLGDRLPPLPAPRT